MESQNAFSNKLYSGGDVVSQSSDDSVYEVLQNDGWFYISIPLILGVYLFVQNPDPSENVITQRPKPARQSNVYTSILDPKSGKNAMEKMSKKSGQWQCGFLACNVACLWLAVFITFLTFILATMSTFIFVEMTHINPFSFHFSMSEKSSPTPSTEPTTVPTTTVQPIEYPCVNYYENHEYKFFIGNTQYFVKTNLNWVFIIAILKVWITCDSFYIF